MRRFGKACRLALVLLGVVPCGFAAAQGPAAKGSVDDPRYYERDPDETVITDIKAWSHPVKAVFARHRLQLTKVELMWGKTFPVFHVKDFGADPAGLTDAFFAPLELDLAEANGGWAYKVVEDSYNDGFVVTYDARTRTIHEQLVQHEAR